MTRDEAAEQLKRVLSHLGHHGEVIITDGGFDEEAIRTILSQGYAPEGKVIVAVNSHDDLVKALERWDTLVTDFLDMEDREWDDDEMTMDEYVKHIDALRSCLYQARDALKKAKGDT